MATKENPWVRVTPPQTSMTSPSTRHAERVSESIMIYHYINDIIENYSNNAIQYTFIFNVHDIGNCN